MCRGHRCRMTLRRPRRPGPGCAPGAVGLWGCGRPCRPLKRAAPCIFMHSGYLHWNRQVPGGGPPGWGVRAHPDPGTGGGDGPSSGGDRLAVCRWCSVGLAGRGNRIPSGLAVVIEARDVFRGWPGSSEEAPHPDTGGCCKVGSACRCERTAARGVHGDGGERGLRTAVLPRLCSLPFDLAARGVRRKIVARTPSAV